MNTSENNKRIAQNTIFLYIRMFMIMLVTLYTSRVVLRTLGVLDYGIYNIVGGIVVMFSFFNSALTSATQRFLSFELGKGNKDKFRTIVNVSFIVYVILSLLILCLGETIGLWFLNNKMDIPNGKITDANWVYQFSLIAFIGGIIRTPYNASIIAHEKMSFYAIISIVEVLLRLLIVYLLLFFPYNKLIMYAILTCAIIFIITCSYIIFCCVHFEECRPRKEKNFSILKHLLSFSAWSMIGSFATVASNQGVNIVMNLFFGVTVNAAMGISHQVSQAVNQFVSNFQVAFNPQITKSYATGDTIYLSSLMQHTGKLSIYIMAILSIPIIVGIDMILDLWLTVVPEHTNIFCQMTIIAYLIDTLSAPLYMTVQATGNIRTYQICVSSFLILNIIFSYLLFALGFPPKYAMIVKIGVSLSLLIYRIIYIQKKIGIQMREYLINTVLKPICLISILFYASFTLYPINTNYTIRICFLILTAIISIISIFYIGLSNREKRFVTELIKNKIKKHE